MTMPRATPRAPRLDVGPAFLPAHDSTPLRSRLHVCARKRDGPALAPVRRQTGRRTRAVGSGCTRRPHRERETAGSARPVRGPVDELVLCLRMRAGPAGATRRSRWTTTSDRADCGRLLHRPGGPQVEAPRCRLSRRRRYSSSRRRGSGAAACESHGRRRLSKRPSDAARHRSNSRGRRVGGASCLCRDDRHAGPRRGCSAREAVVI